MDKQSLKIIRRELGKAVGKFNSDRTKKVRACVIM